MKINKWKVFQIMQLILFIGVSVFLFVRSVDGSGAVNTINVKWISFAIWVGVYLFLLAIEYAIRFLTVSKKKNRYISGGL